MMQEKERMAAENRKMAEDEERRRLYEIEHQSSLLQEKAETETYAKDLEVKLRQKGAENSSLEEQGSHKNLRMLGARRTQRMEHVACESELADVMRTCTRVRARTCTNTLEHLPSHHMRDVHCRVLILTHAYTSYCLTYIHVCVLQY